MKKTATLRFVKKGIKTPGKITGKGTLTFKKNSSKVPGIFERRVSPKNVAFSKNSPFRKV